MQYRRFGKTNWQVSEIGYGMWGLAGWTGSDDKEITESLHRAVELGCNFFDTAWGYGSGLSEQILGKLIKDHPEKKLYAATKIPPKNRKWPSKPDFQLEDVFPADYIVEYTEKSLSNLGVDCIDLLQFHVWEDAWANRDEWKKAITQLTEQGKVKHWGISVNRWEPDNSLKSLQTNLFSAVQVIYNIFDQAPEDNLLPLCRELNIGVIARVPITPPMGRISINAQPWAEVWIDGVRIGETPIANVSIALGVREIVFRNPQFGERKLVTTITGGTPAALSVDFTKQ